MILDALETINWLAVVVATVAYFVFGAIYYAQPVMGRAWMRAAGVTLPEGYRPPPTIFIATLVAYFLTALATALLAAAAGVDTVGDAVVLGVVVFLGYVFAIFVTGVAYERRSGDWLWINGLYNLIALIGVALIVGLWD